MKRIIRYVTGFSFLVLGVAGLFLPVLQGVLFIIVGLLILAPESRIVRRMIALVRLKYPELFAKLRRFRKKKGFGKKTE